MTISMATLMMTCAPLVHPTTLRALIDVESAGNPYAVSINYPAALNDLGVESPDFDQPHSVLEALQLTQSLTRQGFSTSVGLAQINTEHLARLNLRLADLFNPCVNLAVAQRVLLDCDSSQGHGTARGARARLERTLSCYNAGNFATGVTNYYASRVARAAARHLHPTTRSMRSAA